MMYWTILPRDIMRILPEDQEFYFPGDASSPGGTSEKGECPVDRETVILSVSLCRDR